MTPAATISLQAIMNEKYVAMFQTVEEWNDYKRTGFPTFGRDAPTAADVSIAEREANPNTPADGARNWNDTGPVSSNCG